MKPFALGTRPRLQDLVEVARLKRPVVLPPAARARMARARAALERAAAGDLPIYGVNTGFAQFAFKRISREDVRALNLNYIRSHSSGVGEPLLDEQARGVVFLRANELARGHGAARPLIVEMLAALLNRDVVPVIPSRGSVGASGDLAPMAHVALLLIGEGEARRGGRRLRGAAALRAAGLSPLRAEAKEGLALTNGTQAMQSIGGLALHAARRVLEAAQAAGAASLEAVKGTPGPFAEPLVRLKPHPGQLAAARRLRELLKGSEIRESHRDGDERVQDPYSFRCMPQVHGAVQDALEQACAVMEREMASVTDNPVLAGGEFYSGGNFHGMAIAMAMDQAACGLTVLGGVSERRTYYMTAGAEGVLPLYLAQRPGVESGFMIPQYAAAALASENMTLAHPASVGSIPTSANKEDFVSMGMWGALKLARVLENVATIVAIELLTAARALEFHRPLKAGRGVEAALAALRRGVPPARGDVVHAPRIEAAKRLVLEGAFGGIA